MELRASWSSLQPDFTVIGPFLTGAEAVEKALRSPGQFPFSSTWFLVITVMAWGRCRPGEDSQMKRGKALSLSRVCAAGRRRWLTKKCVSYDFC